MGSKTSSTSSASSSRIWRLMAVAIAVLALGLSSIGLSASASADEGSIAVGDLQTNARTKPLGIPGDDPMFGWKSTSSARGVMQKAYEVKVGTSSGGDDVWSSGKVDSARQVDVKYDGPALASQTRYYWQVKVWNGDDQASDWSAPTWFETGILTAGEWSADWIGKSDSGEIDKWTDYTADVDFDIKDLAIGVFIRAKDTANAYMWQISTADGTGIPKFRPHKRVNNSYTLLDNKPITSMTSAQLLEGTHRLSVKVDGSTITTSLDGTQIDQRTDSTFTKGFVGFRQDFANDVNETADVKAVKVTAKSGDVLLDTDFSDGNPFNGGTLTDDGLRVGDRKDVLLRTADSNKPLLRKEFATEDGKTIKSARVYASAHGTYELELNGQKVGDQFLAPGDTDYTKRIQYQTYDVTDQLNNGQNAIGAELGDGWWAGKVGMWGPGLFGSSVGLIAQLRIDYTDGTHQVIKTDNTWKSHSGPFAAADNIDGETYDARAEQPGWDYPNYDAAAWNAVTVGASTDTAKLVPQPDEPVRVTGERPALKRTSPATNTYIYDLGQNMVGVAKMRLQGVAGQTVKIRYGEVLNKDGSLYTANLRAAKVTDYYTFATTGTAVYEPKFTQHGYRYLEISNVTTAPDLGDVTGVVWGSDLKATGTLETSNAMLNQLQSNISWGQRGNFLSIPTDTPARDERLGWTGDINVFAPTASYLRDTRAFLGKWTADLRDSAYSNGNLPGIAPSVPTIDIGSGLGWSDSAITVPYAAWHAQADDAIVKANYASMKKFFDFVKAGAGADLIDSARGNWNDWLNLDDNTGTDVLGTAYYAEDARMLSEMAKSIGEDADSATYGALSDQIRDAFTSKLISADGTVDGGSQTAYAMALGMNLVTDPALREKVGEKFVAKLKTSDYHLTTGFLGTPWLLPALSSIGRTDLAYTMILKKDYPSWGYEIENGATTMWERWNSIDQNGNFGDVSMNSFNHYAYGAVGDWMYQNIGGISAIKAGYKESKIAPAMGGDLTSGHGTYESVYGTIDSDWKKTDKGLSLDIKVPVNTTSKVSVPARNIASVTEGNTPITQAEGVSDVSVDKGVVTFTVGSGSYSIHADAKRALFGDILAEIQKTDDHAGDLATAGDLGTEDRTFIGDSLATASGKVNDALAADLGGDPAQVSQRLGEGLTAITALKTWVAGSTVDGPVKSDLTTRLESIEALFGKAIAANLGVTVVLPPVAEPGQPGATVPGTVEIANAGDVAVSDLKAAVKVDDWNVDPATLTKASVGAGDSFQLPFTVTVPKHQKPGTYDASVKLTFTTPYGTFTLNDSTPWVSVTSGVDITTVTSANPVDGSDERASLTATVKNNGDSAVAGQITAALPDGWQTPPPSERVTIQPGETKDVVLPLFAGIETVAGDQKAEVDFVDQGVTLAEKDATLTTKLATPPTQDVLDYVDFGNAASENAHAIMAAPASGTNTEAGLDRRYANSANPGSWYSAEVHVTPGEPFMLRNRETFDGARTKKYNIYVDDTLVKTYTLKRTESGAGTKTYQTVIDDPAVLDNDGTVRIKYEYPMDASGFYDPSIADSWVLPVPDDSLAPLASASVTSAAAPGDNGWFRGDASVSVTAVDNRDAAPSIDTGTATGWQPYVAPITVTGDGKHEVSYRAKDAAGNSTGEKKAQVWIDGLAPTTQVAVTRGTGVENSDKASLTLSAQDALSGVAATTYRIDGGDWKVLGDEKPQVTGYGQHTIDYFSSDVAGNTEALHSTMIELADVDKIAVIIAPQITGWATYGATLTASTGSWNTTGLAFAYQWLRDGKTISGATASTYQATKSDLGHRLSVRVTASKTGKTPVSSTSAQTAKVIKAPSKVGVSLSSTSVKHGKKITVWITVTSSSSSPTGSVTVYLDGKKVTTKTLKSGKASTSVTLKKKGKHAITAKYSGSSITWGTTSAKVYATAK